ncbi:MAG: hypothetical protein J6P61_01895, partial [Erysipelotrichaceae bacterium]|nr:hypothetical protein [Erysipelotrichaceae bacterium]
FDDGLYSDINGVKRYLTIQNGLFTTSLTNDGTTIYHYSTEHETITHHFTITNAPLKQHLSCLLFKSNLQNQPLSGALFKVSHNNQILTFKKSGDIYQVVNGIEGDVVMSDDDGMIRLGNLEAGEYTLIEVKAPKGYKIASPMTIHIADQETTSVTIIDDNEEIVVTGRNHHQIRNICVLLLFGILWFVWRRR